MWLHSCGVWRRKGNETQNISFFNISDLLRFKQERARRNVFTLCLNGSEDLRISPRNWKFYDNICMNNLIWFVYVKNPKVYRFNALCVNDLVLLPHKSEPLTMLIEQWCHAKGCGAPYFFPDLYDLVSYTYYNMIKYLIVKCFYSLNEFLKVSDVDK